MSLRMFGAAPGLLSVSPNTYNNYFIIEGEAASTTFGLYRDRHPGESNDATQDTDMGVSITTNASGNGAATIQFASYTNGPSPPYDWYCHVPANSNLVVNRTNGTLTSFDITNHHPYPSAVTSGTLMGEAGDTKNFLHWNTGATVDTGTGTFKYTLQRSTTSATSGFANVTGAVLTTNQFFLDTSRTNGTSYWYRVLVFYDLGFVSVGDFLVGGLGNASNVVKLVPRITREYMGTMTFGV